MDFTMCHFSHGQFPFLTLLLLVLPWTLICTPLPSPSVVEKSSRFLDCCKTHSSYQLSCNIFTLLLYNVCIQGDKCWRIWHFQFCVQLRAVTQCQDSN